MKLIITIEVNGNIILPRSYNHIVQGWLYTMISDPAYRIFLHNQGYQSELVNRVFKFFTFSRLMGAWHLDDSKKNMIFTGPIKLQLASPLMPLMQEVASSALLEQDALLGKNMIRVTGLEIKHDDLPLEQNTFQIKALSPIVVYRTMQEANKKTTRYYHPGEAEFNQLVKENLLRKSQVLLEHGFKEYGPLNGDFIIRPLFDPLKRNSTAFYYKDFFIKGYMGIYEVVSEQIWLKVALDTGLGAKNAQGLGMVELNI